MKVHSIRYQMGQSQVLGEALIPACLTQLAQTVIIDNTPYCVLGCRVEKEEPGVLVCEVMEPNLGDMM
jgi:hypothetical protein